MKKVYSLILFWCLGVLPIWADRFLKVPLAFVPSDSIIVFGEDRSDFRMAALSVAPRLRARHLSVGKIDKRALKRKAEQWDRETLSHLNILGAVGSDVCPVDAVAAAEVTAAGGTLFLCTADARYMDVVERTSLNALMAVATPGELTFEKRIAAQALMNVSGMVYAADEAGLFVNMYINSSTHVKTAHQDFVIDQLTAMPHSGRVKLRITGLRKGLHPMLLRLRMPDWACRGGDTGRPFSLSGTSDKLPTVYVNGREEFYRMEKGYLVIDRKWNSGDEVFFDFPFQVQQLSGSSLGQGFVALQRGPLVYGFGALEEGMTVCLPLKVAEGNEPNRYGHTLLQVPMIARDGRATMEEAAPVMDGAVCWWLKTASTRRQE